MSIRAVNWALTQRTDGPSAQIVLFVIADSASEHGVTRHADPDYICEKTRQSRGTVFRRLAELERVGLLARFVKHKPDGRRSYEIRLNLDAAVNYKVDSKHRTINIYAFEDEKCAAPVKSIAFDESADGEPAAEGECQIETQGECKFETQGESHPCNSVSLTGETHHSIHPNLIQDSPPKPPLSPAEAAEESTDEGQDETIPFHRFEVNYPIPVLKPQQARTIWSSMTDAEREQAIDAARGYARFVERERRRAMDAHKWLRERLWTKFVTGGPANLSRVFVAEGEDAFEAWRIAYQLRGHRDLPYFWRATQDGRRGASVPSAYPPLGRGLPPFSRETWVFVPQGDNRWWAWRERLVQAFGEGVRMLTRHQVDGVDCDGAWFPSDWPLRKSTGPPAPLTTQDLAELERG